VVQFTAETAEDVPPANLVWNFGDETATATGASPSHTYSLPGLYDVTLTLTGAGGAAVQKTKVGYIRVAGNAPVAAFTASATEGPAPLAVSFTDTSTGNITAREWDFGDGLTASSSTGGSTLHTYSAAGEYAATLTVVGPAGASTESMVITAQPGGGTWAIPGRITGDLQAGIDVGLSGTDLNLTVQSITGGTYGFPEVSNGPYRITPIRAGYMFEPPGIEVQVFFADRPNIDFTATAAGPALAQPVVTPERAPADGATQVTITVSISHPPPGLSAITSVTADLTPIGGSSSAPLVDDGTAGDAAAGDGVYTLVTTVSNTTEPGLKALRITALDRDGVPGTAFAALDVIKHFSGSFDGMGTDEYVVTNGISGQTLQFVLTQTGGASSSMALAGRAAADDCAPTMVVLSPGGVETTGEAGGASQTTVEVADAEEGPWTCEVGNLCDTTMSYGLESSISGSGIVSGLVVDSRTGKGITGVDLATTAGVGSVSESGVYMMLHPSGTYALSASMAGFLTAGKSLSVSAGGTTEMNIALDNGTETGGCFLTSSLGEGRRLGDLRLFRDRVLRVSEQGRRYRDLYYRHSPEIVALMQRDRELAGVVYRCIGELFPLVEAMLRGKDAAPDARQREVLQGCLEKLRLRAKPKLKAEISQLLKSLAAGKSIHRLLQ